MIEGNRVQAAIDYAADLADGADRDPARMEASLYVLSEAVQQHQNAMRAMCVHLDEALGVVGGALKRAEKAEDELGMDTHKVRSVIA